jgi:hypothetical protein
MLFNNAEPDIGPLQNVTRMAKYVLTRAVMLFSTVDEAIKGDIDYAIGMSMKGLPGTSEERAEIFEQRKAATYEAAGLNIPFLRALYVLAWTRAHARLGARPIFVGVQTLGGRRIGLFGLLFWSIFPAV